MCCAVIAFSHIALQMTPLFAVFFWGGVVDSCAQQAHFLSLQRRQNISQTGMQSKTSHCFPALYFTLDCCLDIHIKHIGNACKVDILIKTRLTFGRKGTRTSQQKTKLVQKYKFISNKQVKNQAAQFQRVFFFPFLSFQEFIIGTRSSTTTQALSQ